ncbi:MAG: Si-specific NAD(P)(+) transhydrogenase [Chloroflexota bacterium]|nr:Si-specific NAD(P)(+) transhydrogenase [Chloroflexota bacterium]
MENFDYDILVIGTGPAGQKAALAAAKAGQHVAIIERRPVVGGVCINTGTIPSKTMREAVLYLSGWREHAVYGASYAVKQHIEISDLLMRCEYVMRHEIDVIRHQMSRNDIEVINACASFIDPHTLQLDVEGNRSQRTVRADWIVIATGTDAARGGDVALDGKDVFTSDDILQLDRIPHTLAVIGAGVIGCEYASIFAALGVRVTLVDARPNLLSFVDEEIVGMLCYHLRDNRATLRLGETVVRVDRLPDNRVRTTLQSGKQLVTDMALHSVGREGATGELNLPAAGVVADSRGRIPVDENYQTNIEHVYAVGDVIGFPSLASTSMEQGRIAVCHALQIPVRSEPSLFPYGIYTVPEISMVGKTEQELTEEGIPYEVGKAQYREIARGQIIGDMHGVLKVIFHAETRHLLGVHIIGEGASELIHIGQAVLAFEGKVDYFIDTVFNYPTLAECYKVAAFDGINRLAE